MDVNDPIFAHQVSGVNALSSHCDQVIVLTGRLGSYSVEQNVKVVSYSWRPGHGLGNVFRFYRVVIPKLLIVGIKVFSHMTDVQSALISPLTFLFRIKHFLWYAHASNSIYLKWSKIWLDGILTSTAGSCPINNSKVRYIGQGIDPESFPPQETLIQTDNPVFIHFGRLDPSKRVEELIEVCGILRERGLDLSFRQIGSPSSNKFEGYAAELKRKYGNSGWVTFVSSIPRGRISAETADATALIHNFVGSLDKTLVESTLRKLPVLTTNIEYIKIFGSWSGQTNPTLLDECDHFLAIEPPQKIALIERRYNIALEHHSLRNWANSISREILGGKKGHSLGYNL